MKAGQGLGGAGKTAEREEETWCGSRPLDPAERRSSVSLRAPCAPRAARGSGDGPGRRCSPAAGGGPGRRAPETAWLCCGESISPPSLLISKGTWSPHCSRAQHEGHPAGVAWGKGTAVPAPPGVNLLSRPGWRRRSGFMGPICPRQVPQPGAAALPLSRPDAGTASTSHVFGSLLSALSSTVRGPLSRVARFSE